MKLNKIAPLFLGMLAAFLLCAPYLFLSDIPFFLGLAGNIGREFIVVIAILLLIYSCFKKGFKKDFLASTPRGVLSFVVTANILACIIIPFRYRYMPPRHHYFSDLSVGMGRGSWRGSYIEFSCGWGLALGVIAAFLIVSSMLYKRKK